MRKLALTTWVVVLLGILAPATAQKDTYEELLRGSWILESVGLRLPDGTFERPYGPNSKGVLILERNGRFVFVVVDPNMPQPRYGDTLNPGSEPSLTPSEAMAIAKGSLSFFGTYLVEGPPRSEITFLVETSSAPDINGHDRYFSIEKITANELIMNLIPPPGGRSTMAFAYKRAPSATQTK